MKAKVTDEGLYLQAPKLSISYREGEVLGRALMGWSSQEIAKDLEISAETVKRHLYNAFDVIGIGTRAELMAWARQRDREHYEAQIRALGGTPKVPPIISVRAIDKAYETFKSRRQNLAAAKGDSDGTL